MTTKCLHFRLFGHLHTYSTIHGLKKRHLVQFFPSLSSLSYSDSVDGISASFFSRQFQNQCLAKAAQSILKPVCFKVSESSLYCFIFQKLPSTMASSAADWKRQLPWLVVIRIKPSYTCPWLVVISIKLSPWPSYNVLR